MKLLAAGDTHIGKATHLSPTRLAEQEEAWRDVLELARSVSVDAVVHAGDAFDKRRPTPDELLAFERPLIEHAEDGGAPVFIINGNGSHDVAYGQGDSPLQVFDEAGLLRLYRQPAVYRDSIVSLAFLPWAPTAVLRARLDSDIGSDEVNAMCAELLVDVARQLRSPAGGPQVLVTHFSVSGSLTPEGASVDLFREPVLAAPELAALGFDTVVCGHIHKPQTMVADPAVLYVGSPMPLTFGEGGSDHGCWIIESGAAPRFVPVDSPGMVTVDWRTAVDLSLDGDLGWEHAYLRVKDTIVPPDGYSPRHLERDMVAAGARYAKVELTPERVARGRVDSLDDEVSEGDAFRMWLNAVEAPEDERGWLLELDQRYREQVAA